ncbi:DUF4214 domain-containing protein [Novosphingobium sp. NBM11]|uniref:DUF4214 domain-containing protein n=1 Tax=Novosphingobium sp. NBM11 TaxID=2596914 RepID=UPI0018927159|nr:DUF4214 domain-containing protein [Novosphingobium sp. NBM11]MBF5090894.1 DUF4214 domain-containing protein [Novosphingobium sp. NBM11]
MVSEQGRVATQSANADCIHVSHFFDFHDEEFLNEVYAKLLGRQPDPSGLATYLPMIRSGETRYRVIEAISRSPEAGEKGVRVFGMKSYRRMRKISRIPIIGRLTAGFMLFWNAQDMLRDLRALENHVYRVSKKSGL